MRIALAALVAATLAACSQVPQAAVDPETGRLDLDVEPPAYAELWNASLVATNGSGMSGIATARISEHTTHVNINIIGAASGSVYPWHVHEGRCGDSGPIVGPAAAYPPLTVGANGGASAQAQLVDRELNEAVSYYVNVHASPDNLAVIVACGELDD